jgi:hypothetical protein
MAKSKSQAGATAKGRHPVLREGDAWAVRETDTGPFLPASRRVHTVIEAAENAGLMQEKTGRIGGRVSPRLIAEAKRRTGIQADSDLIAFALANVALEDDFAQAFKTARGRVDPELDLGF